MKERGVAPSMARRLDAFLVAVSGEDIAPVLRLAHELRDRGIAVEYGLHLQAIRKQFELAVARGAPRAVIIGPDERKNGECVVRDLVSGTEERVPLAQISTVLRADG